MLTEPNPFSTCYVQPGALRYVRQDQRPIAELATEFMDRCKGWASIIGPHGSGKSTLMSNLKGELEKSFTVQSFRLTTSERSLTSLWQSRPKWKQGTVIMIDGFEQLSFWSAWWLCRAIRLRRAHLLVTAHRRYKGFPVLWETKVDELIVKELRDELLASRPDLRSSTDLETIWQATRRRFPTDMRETWMSMYDWVEEKRKTARKSC